MKQSSHKQGEKTIAICLNWPEFYFNVGTLAKYMKPGALTGQMQLVFMNNVKHE